MISYERLWNLLDTRSISQYFLIKNMGISPSQLTRLKHDKGVSTHTLNNFCTFLGCGLDDIAEYRNDGKPAYFYKRSARHR